MTAKKLSLRDFAKQFERPDCIVCILPEREEIDANYTNGVKRPMILKWLWEQRGYGDKSVLGENGQPKGVSSSMLDKHLQGGHHFRKDNV